MVNWQWAMDNKKLAITNWQWEMGNWQWAMDNKPLAAGDEP